MTKVDEMLLMAYVDGEVDAATAREIETQLAREPETQAHVTRMREQSALLRAAFAPVGQEIVPDGLRRAAMGAPMPRQAAAGGRRFAMPLAAGIVGLAVGLGLGLNDDLLPQVAGTSMTRSGAWVDQIVGFHKVYTRIYQGEDRPLVDVLADDTENLQHFFGSQLRRELTLPDLSQRGLALQGGRLLVVDGRQAAQIMYLAKDGAPMALSILPSAGRDRMPAFERRSGGVNVLHWRTGNYGYALVGSQDEASLRAIAGEVAPVLAGS